MSDDVIEGQSSTVNCHGVVDGSGHVILTYLNDVTVQYEDVDTEVIASDTQAVDGCKSAHNSTFSVTFDIHLNSTTIRCQTTSPKSESDTQTLTVIPGKLETYIIYP